MACLDTTVFVDLLRRKSKKHAAASQKLAELIGRGETLVTTRFNVAELFEGVHLAANKKQEFQSVKGVLSGLQILQFGSRAAWLYGKASAYLRSSGQPIGQFDLLIATTAQSRGHLIVTRNPAHFARVPGLVVESY